MKGFSHAERRRRRRELIAELDDGATVEAVSTKYGLSVSYCKNLRALLADPRKDPKATTELIAEQHAAGKTRREIALTLGLGYHYVCRLMNKAGLKSPYDNSRWANAPAVAAARERTAPMAALYRDGYTLEQIGAQYGITRERVRQLISKHYRLHADDGGQRVRADRRAELRRQKRDQKSFIAHGCSWSQYVALRDLKKPTRAFASQRRNAHNRGIGWELTLWDWWNIWQSSGHWEERGRGQGYVMCRKGDTGPYSVGNVFIATAVQNSSDGQRSRRKHPELPIGVRPTPSGKYVAHRCVNGVKMRLGTHATPDLAYAAYLRAAPQTGAAA